MPPGVSTSTCKINRDECRAGQRELLQAFLDQQSERDSSLGKKLDGVQKSVEDLDLSIRGTLDGRSGLAARVSAVEQLAEAERTRRRRWNSAFIAVAAFLLAGGVAKAWDAIGWVITRVGAPVVARQMPPVKGEAPASPKDNGPRPLPDSDRK